MSRYLSFVEWEPAAKTRRWVVLSQSSGAQLGSIRWFGRWRAYCFFPTEQTTFNAECLNDIASFCERETWAHRAEQKGTA